MVSNDEQSPWSFDTGKSEAGPGPGRHTKPHLMICNDKDTLDRSLQLEAHDTELHQPILIADVSVWLYMLPVLRRWINEKEARIVVPIVAVKQFEMIKQNSVLSPKVKARMRSATKFIEKQLRSSKYEVNNPALEYLHIQKIQESLPHNPTAFNTHINAPREYIDVAEQLIECWSHFAQKFPDCPVLIAVTVISEPYGQSMLLIRLLNAPILYVTYDTKFKRIKDII